jgi:hypothetical protein
MAIVYQAPTHFFTWCNKSWWGRGIWKKVSCVHTRGSLLKHRQQTLLCSLVDWFSIVFLSCDYYIITHQFISTLLWPSIPCAIFQHRQTAISLWGSCMTHCIPSHVSGGNPPVVLNVARPRWKKTFPEHSHTGMQGLRSDCFCLLPLCDSFSVNIFLSASWPVYLMYGLNYHQLLSSLPLHNRLCAS